MTKRFFYFLMVCLLAGCTSHKTKLLDFPNTRQSFEYSCGPGAVQSVMAYYGDNFRESELIALMKTDKDEGTYLNDIVKFLHFQGYSTTFRHKMTMGELFGFVDKGIPVIVLIQAWGEDADLRNNYRNCWNDGHFVVVIGYTEKDVMISDPALFNTGSIQISEFMERWHDVDEGETKTYQVGVAVYGKKPYFSHKQVERIK